MHVHQIHALMGSVRQKVMVSLAIAVKDGLEQHAQ